MFKARDRSHHGAGMKEFVKRPLTLEKYINSKNEGCKDGCIYIHVPFCNKICSFCSMRRSLMNPSEDYGDLVVKEIKKYSKANYIKNSTFKSVYFGGGTPTTLKSEDLEKILYAIKENLSLKENAEISLETTITELDSEKIKRIKTAGANRLSIGVQTFNDDGRKLLGRLGSGNNAINVIKDCMENGFENVNIDLIYNYPFQNIDMLKYDLDKIFSLKLGGFSFYSLINMNQSILSKKNLPINDKEEEFFNLIYNEAKCRGFNLLELTKLVEHDNYEYIKARHRGKDTLALGAGAGGNIGDFIYCNPIEIEKYRESVLSKDFTMVTGMVMDEKYKIMNKILGQVQECNLDLKKYEMYLDKEYKGFIEKLINECYIKNNGKHELTRKGVYWGNNICKELTKYIL